MAFSADVICSFLETVCICLGWCSAAPPGIRGKHAIAASPAAQVVRETTHDTKLLVASGVSAVVLAFRGTASAPGCFADLQAWQSRHPRQPGGITWPSLVHSGFLKVWPPPRKRHLTKVWKTYYILVMCQQMVSLLRICKEFLEARNIR